MHELYTQQILL